MSKRHKDALAIQEGACNPSGICCAILDACKEVRNERGTPTEDAAVRLMVHQLGYICKAWDDYMISENTYHNLTEECKEKKDI